MYNILSILPLCMIFMACTKYFELENKGIVFKGQWFVRLDINMGATIMPESFHENIMVMPVFYHAVQTRRALKKTTLYSHS